MLFHRSTFVRHAVFFFLFVACLNTPSFACTDTVPVALGEPARLGGALAGEALGFEVWVPSRGRLTVRASAPLHASPAALGRLTGCADGARARMLRQDLAAVTLTVEPGVHRFFVAAQDRAEPMAVVDVRAGFEAVETETWSLVEGEEDPDEVDVDPDPFRAPVGCHFIEGEEDPDEVDVDPDPFRAPTGCSWIEGEEDPDEVDVDPDPFAGEGGEGGSTRRRLVLDGGTASGLWRLRVEGADGLVGLFDERGRRLVVARGGIDRLLLPGTYLVEAEDSSVVDASPWAP